jgi:hypothetical protein
MAGSKPATAKLKITGNDDRKKRHISNTPWFSCISGIVGQKTWGDPRCVWTTRDEGRKCMNGRYWGLKRRNEIRWGQAITQAKRSERCSLSIDYSLCRRTMQTAISNKSPPYPNLTSLPSAQISLSPMFGYDTWTNSLQSSGLCHPKVDIVRYCNFHIKQQFEHARTLW